MNLLLGLLTLAYPALIYYGMQYAQPSQMAGLLAAILLMRLLRIGKTWARPILFLSLAYAGFAFWNNQLLTLRFYPVLVNAAMLLAFALSLAYPPTIIERLARLQDPDLPPQGVQYTRRVTQVWCGFFIVNGSIAAATAVWSSFEIWSLYNGLIAYILMGLLFGGEYLLRRRFQKQG